MQRRINLTHFLCFAIITLTGIIITSSAVSAQSGRRVPPPVSTPTPTPEPEETPKPSKPKNIKPLYTFKIVRDIPNSIQFELQAPERMQSWAVERLSMASGLEVFFGGEANRKEAIDMAKISEGEYVVLLQLEENQFAAPSRGRTNTKAQRGEIWIYYYVFAPKTGKAESSGRIYLNESQQMVGVLGRTQRRMCNPNLIGDDYLLFLASIETADRIMSRFNITVPPPC